MAGWSSIPFALGSIALAAGCAAPGPPSPATPYGQAVQRAAAYCKSKGMFLRMDTAPRPTRSEHTPPELQFRCVRRS